MGVPHPLCRVPMREFFGKNYGTYATHFASTLIVARVPACSVLASNEKKNTEQKRRIRNSTHLKASRGQRLRHVPYFWWKTLRMLRDVNYPPARLEFPFMSMHVGHILNNNRVWNRLFTNQPPGLFIVGD